jgi:hypothetical protein
LRAIELAVQRYVLALPAARSGGTLPSAAAAGATGKRLANRFRVIELRPHRDQLEPYEGATG